MLTIKARLQRSLMLISLVLASAWPAWGQKSPPEGPRPLEPKTREEVEAMVLDVLRQLGDLGAYVEGIDQGGHILWNRWEREPPAEQFCNTPPPKTTLNKPSVPVNRVQQALKVLRHADAEVRRGRDIKLTDQPLRKNCGHR